MLVRKESAVGGLARHMSTRTKIVILIGLLASSAASGETPLPAEGQETEDPAFIAGYVVQVGSGEPLGKARVLLRPERGRSPVFGSVTDSSGRFVLANIRAGNYRLYVERDGYVDQQYGQVSPSRPGTVLGLAPGQQVEDVLISLVPTGTIAGRVFDEDGEPIVGASVRALRYDYRDGQKVLSRVEEAETDDLGEYRLYWLTPGEYYVSATFEDRFRAAAALREAILAGGVAEPNGLTLPIGRGALAAALLEQPRDPLEEIYVDTYYPGTNDPVTAAPLVIEPGLEVRAVDFTALRTRAVTIRGQVVGPFSEQDGLVPTVAIVSRNSLVASGRRRGGFGGDGRGGRSGRGGADRDGTFELRGIGPGSYTLVAAVRSQGRGGQGGGVRMVGFFDIEVGGEDIEGLIIPVQQGIPVAGRVLVDESANQINVSRLRVRLDAAGNLPIGSPNGRVGDDGTFQINNVSQALHRVSLTGLPEDAYLARAHIGGQDILRDGLQVTPDVGPIEFWVSGAGAVLDGIVEIGTGQTYTGAQVVLIPDEAARDDLYKVASADQYGRFSLRGIAPGSYRVFAWEDAPSGAYQDPDFVRHYDDFGQHVDIEQGGLFQVQPQLIPAGP